jgi:exopolysaccharide production protein ExoZ
MSAHKEIIGLQYLRGLAALGVVLDHAAGMTALPKYFGADFHSAFLKHGQIGVDLFFLISGFIIATVALTEDHRPATNRKMFAWRRFARIVPLMWLAILTYAGLRLLGRGGAADIPAYVRAMLLVPWGDVSPDVIWTLRHEAIFYVLFAITFLGRAWLRPLIVLWIAAPVAYTLLGLTTEPVTSAGQALRLFAHPVNVEFGMGLLIGLLAKGRPTGFIKLSVDPYFALGSLFAGLVFVSAILGLTFGSAWHTIIAALLCAPILILGLAVHCPPSWIGRLGLLLGNASFAIYLFHLHALSALLGVMSKVAHGLPAGIVVAISTLAATATGVVIHLCVEKHIVRRSRLITG